MIKDTERLLYRRQFVIGTRYMERSGWKQKQLNDRMYLSVHPDLDLYQSNCHGFQLTLLGYVIDPYHPERSNEEILQQLHAECRSFEQLLTGVERFGGRWILIYHDEKQLKLFTDACGMRQVFYSVQPDGVWCASQAVALADLLGARKDDDEELQAFIRSPEYKQTEHLWPGDGTLYKGVKHLTPNHYLDVESGAVTRYWPVARLEPIEIEEAVASGAEILKGSIRAIANRSRLMLPVTAGWDSRILLAASRDVSDEVHYYIALHSGLSENATDVQVPARLLASLGKTFHIHPPGEQMADWFVQVNKQSTLMRDLPKSQILYQHYVHAEGKVNISGNYSEIAREVYYDYHPNRTVDARFLSRNIKLGEYPYALRCYEEWLAPIRSYEQKYGIKLLTMFEWEQLYGNWGAIHAAEQDIAIEECSPFNNRKLLATLLSVRHAHGSRNHLYREMVKLMWPEVLTAPINPLPLRKWLRYHGKEALRGTLYYGYQTIKGITGQAEQARGGDDLSSRKRRRKVAIVYKSLPQYRRRFYELLKERLAERDIDFILVYGQPGHSEASKKDSIELEWAHKIENRIFRLGSREVYWQPCMSLLKGTDLVIVEQASKLLVNYWLMLQNQLGIRKVAFWGHGRNFQSHNASRAGEWVKAWLSRRVHWWFAYNQLSAKVVQELGFPEERITSVQNAIDTHQLVHASASWNQEELETVKQSLGIESENVCLYTGGMYPEKRIPFLVEACKRIRELVPDFQMIFIGAGVNDNLIKGAASSHPWIKYIGPKFETEKVPYFKLSKLFLMPGLVGLAVLDTFALGVPLVTTRLDYHSPEIAYLINQENGVMLDDPEDLEGYAQTVAQLLTDDEKLRVLQEGCRKARLTYTVEEMADRFAQGICQAIGAENLDTPRVKKEERIWQS